MYIATKHMCTHADKLEAHVPATLSHPCADFSIIATGSGTALMASAVIIFRYLPCLLATEW